MSIVESHKRWLEGLSSDEMASGTHFPIGVINHFLQFNQNLNVWDIGCGRDSSQMGALKVCGYHPRGLDLNRQAVELMSDHYKFWVSQADATSVMGFVDSMFELPSWIERVDAVVMKGLMPSLLGDTWKNAMDAVDMWLRPGGDTNNSGYLFVADIWDASKPDSRIDKEDPMKWERYQELWQKRLERNYEAFGDNMPYGTFAVGKVGATKNWLDWEASPEQLRYVYDHRNEPVMRDVVERFARHVDREQFLGYMTTDLGYQLIWDKPACWGTRGDILRPVKELPGGLLVLRKPHTYRYAPAGAGYSVDTVDLIERRKEVAPSPFNLTASTEWYWSELLSRAPASQVPAIAKFVRDAFNLTIQLDTER